MTTAIVFLALLVVSAAQTCNHHQSQRNSYIIGGIPARPNEFPWLVSLQSLYEEEGEEDPVRYHDCGASIIHRQWIMTAAHCFNRSGPFIVIAGAHNRSKAESTVQEFNIVMHIVHPEYNDTTLENDIALGRISGRFHLDGRTVATVRLPEPSDYNAFDHDCCIVAGWGLTPLSVENPEYMEESEVVRKVHVAIERMYICSLMRKWTVTEKHLCVGGRFLAGTCHLDSGGPLICIHNGVRMAAGIVSYGPRCLYPLSEVYTRVSSYREWIDQTLISNANCVASNCDSL